LTTGFKKNVNRATTQVMMKTGESLASSHLHWNPPSPLPNTPIMLSLTYDFQVMSRGPTIETTKWRRGIPSYKGYGNPMIEN
jgi:hypothetical protein